VNIYILYIYIQNYERKTLQDYKAIYLELKISNKRSTVDTTNENSSFL